MIAPNESGSALGSGDGDGEISGYVGGCELWTGSGGCICGNIFRGGEIYFSLKSDEDLHACMTQSRHLFKIFNIVWRKRCMPTNWSVFLEQAAISCLRCSRITILHILSHSSSMILVSYILVYRTMITSRIKTSFSICLFSPLHKQYYPNYYWNWFLFLEVPDYPWSRLSDLQRSLFMYSE